MSSQSTEQPWGFTLRKADPLLISRYSVVGKLQCYRPNRHTRTLSNCTGFQGTKETVVSRAEEKIHPSKEGGSLFFLHWLNVSKQGAQWPAGRTHTCSGKMSIGQNLS